MPRFLPQSSGLFERIVLRRPGAALHYEAKYPRCNVRNHRTAIGDDLFVERWNAALAENPQARYFLRKPGYVVCALDRETCRADFRIVAVISTPGTPLETSARFAVMNRNPGAQRA